MRRTTAPCAITAMIWGCLAAIFALIPIVSILGVIFGILGLTFTNKGRKLYALEPERYASPGLYHAAKICSVAGLSVGGLVTIITILVILFV